jgi:mono/diheme cytochrome c family protein
MTFLGASLALGLVACGGGSSSGGGGESSSGGEASYAGAIASSDTAAGQAVYETYCNGCHPGGGEARGPAISDTHESPATARQQVREGGDHMPAFPESRISADDLESLLAYMVTLGAVQGDDTDAIVEAATAPVPEDTTSGTP